MAISLSFFILNILFISFFTFISNLPSPTKINSFTPFYISSNEILFEFEYNSEEKTDLICEFNPYLNEIIFGDMTLYINSINMTDSFNHKEKFFFKEKEHIIINSKKGNNKGKGKYYIHLIGDLHCSIEIFLLNEIKTIDINNSYFFKNIYFYESQNYYSLKIDNLKENIYMNILLFNKNCSSLDLVKNNMPIKCDKEIPNLLLLEKNNEYEIKYNLEIYNFLAINFINTD